MANILFELKQAGYSYFGRFPALCSVDLTIMQGAKTAVIGANGTGKSTLLSMLDALIFPDQGSVKAFGMPLDDKMQENSDFTMAFRRRVGLGFQNPDIQLFCPTVRDDIMFGPLQLRMRDSEAAKRLDKVVTELKLASLLDRSPCQLSIGEKKKVAIASVLAIQPEVLLLDEPAAGLDPQTTRDIIDILVSENLSGTTLVTATHDLHIIEEIADTVHVFGPERNIIRSAPPEEVLSDRTFLQAHNLVHIHRHRHKDAGVSHAHQHDVKHHH
jgi:cobalt/nickel transport system ATP-binding protein